MNNNFIYFPSFSVGNFSNAMKVDKKLRNGLPFRFHSNEFPIEYQHPYFLVTAGHFYKKAPNFTKEWSFKTETDNTLILGDSGGYQIASGAIKWDKNLQPIILKWLEHNSDIAMNLDIPPRLQYDGKFNECLEISIDNFKYFDTNRIGKTDFLNVVQGNDEHTYLKWYNSVKHFNFDGWAIGGAGGSIYRFMSGVMSIINGKEQYNDNRRWLHVLGTSKVIDFLILSQLQKSLNDINSKMRVTTDSSTPSRAVVYGLYYFDVDYKNCNFRSLHIPKERAKNNKNVSKHTVNSMVDEHLLPNICKFDSLLNGGYTFDDLKDWTIEGYGAVILHNFMFFKETIDKINEFINSHPYFLEQIVNTDTFLLLKSIDEMVKAYENGTTPEKVFAKYKNLYTKLSSKEVVSTGNVVHNFFV